MPMLCRKLRILSALAAVLLMFSGVVSARAPQEPESRKTPTVSLKVGDQAPPFVPGKWLKGEPLTALAKGQIYVFEFWATWCGPCKAAIPHLTKLAKQYSGKITFIGVDVWETAKTSEENDKTAADFVNGQGERMDYLVCRDTADGAMAKTWLGAAGIQGIPATFIVDGAGRLVWQGHPLSMDPVLEKLTAGTFDPIAAQAEVKAYKEMEEAVYAALQAKDWKGALALCGKLKPMDDVGALWKRLFEFQANLHVNESTAESTFDKALKENAEEAEYYVRTIVGEDGLSKSWYLKAVSALKSKANTDKSVFERLAEAHSKSGDAKSAAEAMSKYIEYFQSEIPRIMKEHPDAGDIVKAELAKLESRLKEYRAAAK